MLRPYRITLCLVQGFGGAGKGAKAGRLGPDLAGLVSTESELRSLGALTLSRHREEATLGHSERAEVAVCKPGKSLPLESILPPFLG